MEVPLGTFSVSVPAPSFTNPPSLWTLDTLKLLNVRSLTMSNTLGYSPMSRHGRSISVASPEYLNVQLLMERPPAEAVPAPSAAAFLNSVTPCSSRQSPANVAELSPSRSSFPVPLFATVPEAFRTGADTASVPPAATSTPEET